MASVLANGLPSVVMRWRLTRLGHKLSEASGHKRLYSEPVYPKLYSTPVAKCLYPKSYAPTMSSRHYTLSSLAKLICHYFCSANPVAHIPSTSAFGPTHVVQSSHVTRSL